MKSVQPENRLDEFCVELNFSVNLSVYVQFRLKSLHQSKLLVDGQSYTKSQSYIVQQDAAMYQ
jgi:hypothetical protein